MNRQISIRKQILIALEQCGGYLVPEAALLSQINFHVTPSATKAEFDSEINFLDASKFVIGVRPKLGGDCKWKISDEGRAALADF